MPRRRNRFPPDRGLQARMVVALVVQTVLMLALLAGLAALVASDGEAWKLVAFLVLIAAGGAAAHATREDRFRRRTGVREPTADDTATVERLLTRLCLAGAMDPPGAEVHGELPPLAWTTGALRRRPVVHVTTGLLDTLAPGELESVLAHELGHLAHNDAAVMTLLTGPPRWFVNGIVSIARDGGRGAMSAVVLGPFLLPVPLLMCASGLIISRHRELAADRTAALITGSPAGVAAAILRCRDEIAPMAKGYWRGLDKRDAVHFAQLRPPRGIRVLWAAQPRESTRLRALERMEALLQRPKL